jgi:hypothetical protein
MFRKILSLVIICLLATHSLSAQELQARVSVNASRVGNQVDRKVFQTLQTAIFNFLNNRKWTDDVFQPNEKINCNFLINIIEGQDNVYKAILTVQAARPIYNTSYESPLMNHQDDNFTFKYIEHQSLEFNENRISGSEGLVSNLSATLAFYVYIILGLDYDSFSPRGGDVYFQKAMNIVNNSPEGRDITGWRAFDGSRNRYWLMENLTNNRYALIHDAVYAYYRKGLDQMYDNEAAAREGVLEAVNALQTIHNDVSNAYVIPFFFQGKSDEIINIFKKAAPSQKSRIREMLIKMDIANANKYREELK